MEQHLKEIENAKINNIFATLEKQMKKVKEFETSIELYSFLNEIELGIEQLTDYFLIQVANNNISQKEINNNFLNIECVIEFKRILKDVQILTAEYNNE